MHTHAPHACARAGTPADKMLSMMAELLDGMVPSIQDILFVQSAVLESLDIYQPVNLGKQLLHGTNLDVSGTGRARPMHALLLAHTGGLATLGEYGRWTAHAHMRMRTHT